MMSCGRGQRGQQEEVHNVAQENRQKSLREIDKHQWFRHLESGKGFRGICDRRRAPRSLPATMTIWNWLLDLSEEIRLRNHA